VAELDALGTVATAGTFETFAPFFGFRFTSKPSYRLGACRFARTGRIGAAATVDALDVAVVLAIVVEGAFETFLPFFGFRSTSKPSNLLGA